VFREGARIIQVVNDYKQDVFNGEMGYVRKIYTRCNDKGKTEQVLEAEFGDKTVIYKKQDLDNIELGYCLTIHKMQGSGIKYVIVVIDNTHYKLLDSCLLYTGLTRAVKKCLLIAEPQAYDRCIRTKASDRRTWVSLCYQNS
jgi:exodeoxyribonuclease V alpha subunit